MKLMINAIWFLVLLLASVAYLFFIADHVPPRYSLYVNIMLIPLLIGVVAGWLLQMPMYMKLFLLMLIPVIHVLCFGGDPAKPRLENLIAYGEVLFLWLGVVLTYLVDRFICK